MRYSYDLFLSDFLQFSYDFIIATIINITITIILNYYQYYHSFGGRTSFCKCPVYLNIDVFPDFERSAGLFVWTFNFFTDY